jgi:hypothetical protein
MPFDPRIRFLPAANVLITIPVSNDRVQIRSFDLFQALEKSGENFLFVLSIPKTRARTGTLYEHSIVVKSKSGGVRFALESGPPGMKVGADGVLRWQVTEQIDAKAHPVIVTIRDGKGKDIQHSFDITLE